jgi:hypothetical protein
MTTALLWGETTLGYLREGARLATTTSGPSIGLPSIAVPGIPVSHATPDTADRLRGARPSRAFIRWLDRAVAPVPIPAEGC